jgi:hypothetical protein
MTTRRSALQAAANANAAEADFRKQFDSRIKALEQERAFEKNRSFAIGAARAGFDVVVVAQNELLERRPPMSLRY